MSGTYWNPDPLPVGTRVRIRLNGECHAWYPPFSLGDHDEPGFWAEHDPGADGHLGTIDGLFPEDPTGHPYSVKADAPWPHQVSDWSHPISGDMFARVELEPL